MYIDIIAGQIQPLGQFKVEGVLIQPIPRGNVLLIVTGHKANSPFFQGLWNAHVPRQKGSGQDQASQDAGQAEGTHAALQGA
jgi:hypothetical protein